MRRHVVAGRPASQRTLSLLCPRTWWLESAALWMSSFWSSPACCPTIMRSIASLHLTIRRQLLPIRMFTGILRFGKCLKTVRSGRRFLLLVIFNTFFVYNLRLLTQISGVHRWKRFVMHLYWFNEIVGINIFPFVDRYTDHIIYDSTWKYFISSRKYTGMVAQVLPTFDRSQLPSHALPSGRTS